MSSAQRENGVRQAISRFATLTGLGIGALSGVVYWAGVQFWPSSVALMLAVLAGAVFAKEMRPTPAGSLDVLSQVFYVLLKYNVLMALSAAKLPFPAPPNAPLCLIMICGYGASRALLVWMSSRSGSAAARSQAAPQQAPLQAAPLQAAPLQAAPLQAAPLSHFDLTLALLIGFAPAMLLGLPGLIGLATAVLSMIVFMNVARGGASLAAWIAELCFYLGAQASWSYV